MNQPGGLDVVALVVREDRRGGVRQERGDAGIADDLLGDAAPLGEYERGEARVLQTTELRPETLTLLRKLRVVAPAKLLSVGPSPADVPAAKRRRPPPGSKKAPAA